MRLHAALIGLAPAIVLMIAAPTAIAQVIQVSGKVTLRGADGSVRPIAGAHIDLYRTDIAWRAQVTTAADGSYVVAGVPFVGTYTVAVSAPGAAPGYVSDVRPSQRATINVELKPGDGSTLTLAQIQARGPAPAASAAPSAPPAPNPDDQLVRLFEAGNKAFAAKDYDGAIRDYDQALAIRQEPALLMNRSIALRMRGVDRWNAATRLQSEARSNGQDQAKADWRTSADNARRARDLVEAQRTAVAQSDYQRDRINALAAYAEAMKLVATKVDDKQADEAFRVYGALAAETADPALRRQRTYEAAKIYFDASQMDRAVIELRKVTTADPTNAEAHYYLGMALFSTGQKSNYQEAANQLAVARDRLGDSPLKADASLTLQFLQMEEKVVPAARR